MSTVNSTTLYSDFLHQFDNALMALQSSKTTLENVLLAMDFILELLEMGKERFKDDEFMSSCINSAWANSINTII
jgi:hypothetical protein